jgi:hypothetical protein
MGFNAIHIGSAQVTAAGYARSKSRIGISSSYIQTRALAHSFDYIINGPRVVALKNR